MNDSEKLVALATSLDAARLEANTIEAAAPQTGVYGHISKALRATLTLLTDERRAGRMYQFLLDGGTVEEALEWDADQPPDDAIADVMRLLEPDPWGQAETHNREYMSPDHVAEVRGFDDER